MLGFRVKKGFTLIEVIISLFIMEIILTPILGMVLTNVKINKNSENKQKALYIAQQYMEKAKSSDNPQTDSDSIDDFDVYITVKDVTPKSKSPSVNNGDQPTVKYDVQMSIESIGKDNYLKVGSSEQKFQLNTDNDLYIANDLDKITWKFNNEELNIINKSSTKKDKSKGDVFMLFNANNQSSLNIHAINNCDSSEFSLYFSEENENIKYTLSKEGLVKRFYNTSSGSNNVDYLSHKVYKIDVEVKKAEESLQKITDFKNIVE